ncbi:MAG: HAD family hydrolase [Chlorobium sp.]|uniref:HAD family hydrolase n=1 Tax=Chlorobium sp. TaxID=1095 RepID=UPI001DF11740|nr:HAD family hydrolase [Chlorobium sp.]MBN1279772.1 HAD family hydrolase [Chlorobiaceae bacterium]MCF8217338.1 HAD family hydrolase [Chlorobium sp.]MCF8272182.1 HAD family hydrolase [Chlorobium sp.]MCF8288551.1 HAD family hydrolase [Chlorobium sp.]MCF8292151.1 HAD family hydrolase [Chlorobium sp.]
MKYKLVVFDFDGTLADSEASIMESLQLVAWHLGLSWVDQAAARQSIGLPLRRTIEIGLGLCPEEAPEAVDLYRKYYHEVAFDSTHLFPGVNETLERLRPACLLAVASGKSSRGLLSMMQHLGISEYFSFVAGAQDVQQPKPAPDMVLLALARLNISAHECLVVGDTVYDIEMGQRAFADTCAVTYGNHSLDQLRRINPTFIIDVFPHVVNCLEL